MPKVSIIIPTYNCARYLDETLRSIYRQTFTDYEIIIVDDGSTDDTRDILSKHKKRLTYIWQANSGGCSVPRNTGLRAAAGEYLTIFDSDDIMSQTKLEAQVHFLDSHENIDFVFTDYRNFRGKILCTRHSRTCPRFRSLLTRQIGPDEYHIRGTEAYSTLFFENFIAAPSMMFRRNILDLTGGFDESLKSSEDIDFSFRVTQACDIGYVDFVGFLRRLHHTNMSTNIERTLKYKIIARGKQLGIPKDKPVQRQLLKSISDDYLSLAYYYREKGDYKSSLLCHMESIRYHASHFTNFLPLLKTAVLAAIGRRRNKKTFRL